MMKSLSVKLLILCATVSILISNYELARCDSSVSASASASSETLVGSETTIEEIDQDPDAELPINDGDSLENQRELQDSVALLRRSFAREYKAHPNLYDPKDVENLLNSHKESQNSNSRYVMEFLAQRSNNWERAYWLAVETLRWRANLNINQLTIQDFPCDLFRMGLIFEFGNAYKTNMTGQYVAGNRVIWIRLGALGSVVKQLERFTVHKVVSHSLNTAKSAVHMSKKALRRMRRKEKRARRKLIEVNLPRLQVRDLSVKNDRTILSVWKSIAWWLNDWRNKHPVGTKATLVLDFENNDFALSSWSMGEFFIGLDDHFPDLFDQIIGFRFRPKLWSLHSPISMFNRIFKSRIASSPETDLKLKFVKNEPQISNYMPRVDSRGYTMLPDHVHGTCNGPTHEPPAGCTDNMDTLSSSGLYDTSLLQAIHYEFYQICTPKPREQ